MPSISLNISEPAGEPQAPVTEAQIAELVDTFYAEARQDDLLGPIFMQHVPDWDKHYDTMRRFWSSAVLRTGTYSGRPYEAHAKIPGLEQRHFDRWQQLFTEVTNRVVPESAPVFQDLGRRMGMSMLARMIADAD
ncbi:MAG TPA: group III truncated hemoglobin [Phycisphaerales bacterium]|nr:group III truncated hemoglobin [Phycisphaerales bacterium]